MDRMNRREFMGQAAAVAGALALAEVSGAAPARPPKPTDKVAIGQTGIKTSLVGIGTGTRGWGKESNQTRIGQPAFTAMIRHAFDHGIRLFDCADQYGSHTYLREALKGIPRDQYVIETKIIHRDANEAKADLDRFRQELGVDYIDIVLMHVVTERDWNVRYRGVMDVLEEAKQRKVIRAHGCSCHTMEALQAAAADPWVDTDLARFNPWGKAMDADPDTVKPVLAQMRKAGKGVIGMKILAEGQMARGDDRLARIKESIKFGVESGVLSAMVIGMESPQQVTEILQQAQVAMAEAHAGAA